MDAYETFMKDFPVSRETFDQLNFYYQELCRWNRAHNLVQSNDLENFWERHILDCAQLTRYIPTETLAILDLGSGAGLPGIVLAILTNHPVHLFELNHKKAIFLEHIIHTLNLKASVVQGDANQTIAKITWGPHTLVTSRALTSLSEILNLVESVSRETNFSCLLLKSQKQLPTEIQEAQEKWRFHHEIFSSLTSPEGCVLKVITIQRKS